MLPLGTWVCYVCYLLMQYIMCAQNILAMSSCLHLYVCIVVLLLIIRRRKKGEKKEEYSILTGLKYRCPQESKVNCWQCVGKLYALQLKGELAAQFYFAHASTDRTPPPPPVPNPQELPHLQPPELRRITAEKPCFEGGRGKGSVAG